MTAPRSGDVFTHARMLDLDAPVRDRVRARCRVTSVQRGRVYFTYASEPRNHGAFYMSVDEWMAQYGGTQ